MDGKNRIKVSVSTSAMSRWLAGALNNNGNFRICPVSRPQGLLVFWEHFGRVSRMLYLNCQKYLACFFFCIMVPEPIALVPSLLLSRAYKRMPIGNT